MGSKQVDYGVSAAGKVLFDEIQFVKCDYMDIFRVFQRELRKFAWISFFHKCSWARFWRVKARFWRVISGFEKSHRLENASFHGFWGPHGHLWSAIFFWSSRTYFGVPGHFSLKNTKNFLVDGHFPRFMGIQELKNIFFMGNGKCKMFAGNFVYFSTGTFQYSRHENEKYQDSKNCHKRALWAVGQEFLYLASLSFWKSVF